MVMGGAAESNEGGAHKETRRSPALLEAVGSQVTLRPVSLLAVLLNPTEFSRTNLVNSCFVGGTVRLSMLEYYFCVPKIGTSCGTGRSTIIVHATTSTRLGSSLPW
eukprot:SAG11_NODE_273_length_11315_cov_38.599412_2_plen_106_part_00